MDKPKDCDAGCREMGQKNTRLPARVNQLDQDHGGQRKSDDRLVETDNSSELVRSQLGTLIVTKFLTGEVVDERIQDKQPCVTIRYEDGRPEEEHVLSDCLEGHRRYTRLSDAYESRTEFATRAVVQDAARNEGFIPKQLEIFERDFGPVVAKRLRVRLNTTDRPVTVFRAPNGRLFFRVCRFFREIEEQQLQQSARAAGRPTPHEGEGGSSAGKRSTCANEGTKEKNPPPKGDNDKSSSRGTGG